MTSTKDYKVGYKKPPKEHQFGQANANPRNNGAWKKTDTARYKLEKMMTLTQAELVRTAEDVDAPMFERQLAKWIIKGDWNVIERQINQVYGQPKQRIETFDTTPHGIELTILQPKAKEEKKSGEAKQ